MPVLFGIAEVNDVKLWMRFSQQNGALHSARVLNNGFWTVSQRVIVNNEHCLKDRLTFSILGLRFWLHDINYSLKTVPLKPISFRRSIPQVWYIKLRGIFQAAAEQFKTVKYISNEIHQGNSNFCRVKISNELIFIYSAIAH